ncbi:MAG: hypothetical protein H8D45_30630 [Bacteroidetes bacterium]|nr:hypothetical protein [Bacteroidota bacterium]
MINIEVTFQPEDWNKLSKKPWTIHYENNNGMDRGIGEFFATREEAEKRLKEILPSKTTEWMIDTEVKSTTVGVVYIIRYWKNKNNPFVITERLLIKKTDIRKYCK